MRLAEFLTPARVTTSLLADDKTHVLRAMAGLFALEDPQLRAAEVERVLAERESLASTGIGSGVAIPHARTGQVSALRAAMAISQRGVQFDAIDGRPAHIVIAVLAPDRHTGDHLKALARISRLLRDAEVRRRLMEATSASEAFEIACEEDERH